MPTRRIDYYVRWFRGTPRFAAIQPVTWDGDNHRFVVEELLPHLSTQLSGRTIQVLRWAYGYDMSPKSWEMQSDGSSVVQDLWMGGTLKEPYGVGHDMLYDLHRHWQTTPDGHEWTRMEADNWYRTAMSEFGYPARAWTRFVGLCIGGWVAWNRRDPAPPELRCLCSPMAAM